MRIGAVLRGLLLAPGVVLLAGCNDNGGSTAPASVALVEVETYNPETAALSVRLQVSYPAADTAVLKPYTAGGAPLEDGYRQECRFASPAASLYPAVTRRYARNSILNSPTGQILLAIGGFPALAVTGCQDYFPDRPLAGEAFLTPTLTAAGEDGEATTVLRGADGRLTQRHSGWLVEAMIAMSGFKTYDETLHYISDGSRATALVYGAEAWPASGTYTSYSDGNIVIDLFLMSSLGGLVQTAEGLYVSPAGGYAQRFIYDTQGQLTEVRTFDDWGADGQWLTADDVAAADGLMRYRYEAGRLARVDAGLNPADALPTASHQVDEYSYAGGLLVEKRRLDAQGRLYERWRYASR